MPIFCACGNRNNLNHILTCKKGGYVSMRHNALPDTEAKLLTEVCCDVKTGPDLPPPAARGWFQVSKQSKNAVLWY